MVTLLECFVFFVFFVATLSTRRFCRFLALTFCQSRNSKVFAWKIIPALLLRKSLGPEFAYLNSMLMSTLIISPAAVIANKSPKYRPDTRTYERRMVPTGWRSVRGFVVAAQDLSFRVTAD